MVQYHQYLFKSTDAGAYLDQDGNWQAGTGKTDEFASVCRFEVDGKGTEIGVGDGKQVAITGIIYTPASPLTIGCGQEVVVCADRLGSNVLMRLTVVSADEGRLHNRIWVR